MPFLVALQGGAAETATESGRLCSMRCIGGHLILRCASLKLCHPHVQLAQRMVPAAMLLLGDAWFD